MEAYESGGMPAEVRMTAEKPDYQTAALLLQPIIARFYADPENEKAYQEWKAKKDR